MGLSEHIAQKKAELDALRPLSSPTLRELNSWYDVELTYSSNAIEGSTLTRNETAVVLEKGITVSGKPLRDHLEATGHRDALLYIRELAVGADPIREADIRNIHRLVMQRVDPDEAGRYSTINGLLQARRWFYLPRLRSPRSWAISLTGSTTYRGRRRPRSMRTSGWSPFTHSATAMAGRPGC